MDVNQPFNGRNVQRQKTITSKTCYNSQSTTLPTRHQTMSLCVLQSIFGKGWRFTTCKMALVLSESDKSHHLWQNLKVILVHYNILHRLIIIPYEVQAMDCRLTTKVISHELQAGRGKKALALSIPNSSQYLKSTCNQANRINMFGHVPSTYEHLFDI